MSAGVKKLSAETLEGIAAEIAGAPVSRETSVEHVKAFHPLLMEVLKLRSLPLKDIVPPLAFRPEQK